MRKRDLIILLGAAAAALVLTLRLFHGAALETGSWGLSFQEPGKAPVGPPSSEAMRKYDAAYLGDTTQKVLYLTFDAGYENGHTEAILDALKKHNAPAAFFLTGHYIETAADLTRRMVEEGHIVGNHTQHHPDMSKISDMAAFSAELQGLEDLFREKTGKELPKYYRPPQGVYSESNLQMAQELGYRTVFWSLAYVDWDNNAQPEPEKAMDTLKKRTHNGAVVLLHATSATNAQILDDLLTQWEQQGYRFAPLEELFA